MYTKLDKFKHLYTYLETNELPENLTLDNIKNVCLEEIDRLTAHAMAYRNEMYGREPDLFDAIEDCIGLDESVSATDIWYELHDEFPDLTRLKISRHLNRLQKTDQLIVSAIEFIGEDDKLHHYYMYKRKNATLTR